MENPRLLLTPGACERLLEGDYTQEYIVQCLKVKKIEQVDGSSSPDHYLIMASDGQHFIRCLVDATLNYLIESAQLCRHTVFKIRKTSSLVTGASRVPIIKQIDTAAMRLIEPIGSPQALIIRPESSSKGKTVVRPSTEASRTPGVPLTTRDPTEAAPIQRFPQRAVTPPPALPTPSGTPVGQWTAVPTRQPPYSQGDPTSPRRPANLFAINDLNPFQNNWVIKARLTVKTSIRRWSKNGRDGESFTCDFEDESGAIRATVWNEDCGKFHHRLEEGKVYNVSRASLKTSNKQYNNLPHDYELMFKRETEIAECPDEEDVPAQPKLDFIELSAVSELEQDGVCDVLVVVQQVDDLVEMVGRSNGKNFTRRDLVVIDKSRTSMKMVLWGETAKTFDHKGDPVVAFKQVIVQKRERYGTSLTMRSRSKMFLSPDFPEAHLLRVWHEEVGPTLPAVVIGGGSQTFNRTAMKPIMDVINAPEPVDGTNSYFSIRGTVVWVEFINLPWYEACPGVNCSKKVVEREEGAWWCERCSKDYDHCRYVYKLMLGVADRTGRIGIDVFGDDCERIIGVSIQDVQDFMSELATKPRGAGKEKNLKTSIRDKLESKALGVTWNLVCSLTMNTYKDRTRPSYNLKSFSPFVEIEEEARGLLERVKQYHPASPL